MSDVKNLTHSAWECKYHVLWIPKCRRKQLYGGVAKYLGTLFHLPVTSSLSLTPDLYAKLSSEYYDAYINWFHYILPSPSFVIPDAISG
jgi:putative transposase